jgi:hypothetical protein
MMAATPLLARCYHGARISAHRLIRYPFRGTSIVPFDVYGLGEDLAQRRSNNGEMSNHVFCTSLSLGHHSHHPGLESLYRHCESG